MDAGDILKRTAFFADVLGEGDIGALAMSAQRSDYDQGSVLIREGDPGESLFIVVRGAVRVATRDSGADRRVTTLHDGEIVGEMSLLTGARRSATVTALRPTVTLEINKSGLAPILSQSPDLADQFAQMVAERKAELDEVHGSADWLPSAGTVANRIRAFFGR